MRKTVRPLILAALVAAVGPLALHAQVDAPNVKKLGKTVAQYKDDTVKLVVGYKWAQNNLKNKWIFLDTYISAEGSAPVDLDREDFAMFFPDGTRVNLPSQKRLAEGLPEIRRVMAQAQIMSDPLGGYFAGRRVEERLPFFTIPGEHIVQDRFAVNLTRLVYGELWWEAKGPVFEPGIYTLAIKNKQVDVKLPLALGIEGELERIK